MQQRVCILQQWRDVRIHHFYSDCGELLYGLHVVRAERAIQCCSGHPVLVLALTGLGSLVCYCNKANRASEPYSIFGYYFVCVLPSSVSRTYVYMAHMLIPFPGVMAPIVWLAALNPTGPPRGRSRKGRCHDTDIDGGTLHLAHTRLLLVCLH